ncbi:hypothetical protein Patl1_26962 [Pistacia atlantica]|uniref:Uncharacterized protein n=1 Tax=Pistacia atlantica TaxID=434234 RepID=A0ACC1AZ75_9ROSI|nr:hypothetical protein Patl1_26962 [Pistacia atlantica]
MDEEVLNRPLVLVHRPPNFHFPFRHRLATQFNLFDPFDSPDSTRSSLLCRHAFNVRVLLYVDPTPVSSDLMSLLLALELIVGSTVGVDHIDLPECRRRCITVTNAGVAFSEDVADLALGGKRVGMVGMGKIGSEVVKDLSLWCIISYNSRRKKSAISFPYYPDVYELVVNSDVLVVCCALAEETHHIINKDIMTALGKEGAIINIGRGALIDEKEMVKLLVHGEIGGVGLDVFENEPHVPKELFQLDNVVLSPHCTVATPECFDALEELIVFNLKAFFANKPLWSVVNLE